MLESPVTNTGTGGLSDADLLVSDDPLQALLPLSFRSSSEDPIHRWLCPWFWKSIDIVGDVCIFGDPKAAMSLQFAFVLEALLVRKTKNVFCFDRFADPPQASHDDAPDHRDLAFASAISTDLTAWSRVLPIRPVDGDPVETCKLLTAPICLVWFDLPSGDAIHRILQTISPLIDKQAVIGIRDGGDAERMRSVDRLVDMRHLVDVEQHQADGIRFVRLAAEPSA